MEMKSLYASNLHTGLTTHTVTIIENISNGVKLKMTYEAYNANEKFTGEIFVNNKWEHTFGLLDLGVVRETNMYVKSEGIRQKRSNDLVKLGIRLFNILQS